MIYSIHDRIIQYKNTNVNNKNRTNINCYNYINIYLPSNLLNKYGHTNFNIAGNMVK
jgi:hypothetical protein